MKKLTASEARKQLSTIIDKIKNHDATYGVGRYNKVEVLIMKYPDNINTDLSEITNINANSSSFAFLEQEPDLYSVSDLKKKYV